MLFVLIVGRWLSPKGDISRDELSQLLMVYFGTAADILEYVTEGLSNSGVMCNKEHIFIVLIVWSLSLSQFTLSPTATRKKKLKNRPGAKRQVSYVCICFETELWSIFVSTFVQDGPFLGTRLFFMIFHKSRNQSSVFFTCKNALLLMIQAYRVVIIFNNHIKKKRRLKTLATKPKSEKARKVKSTSTQCCCWPQSPAPCVRLARLVRNRYNAMKSRRHPSSESNPSTSYRKVQPRKTNKDKLGTGAKAATLSVPNKNPHPSPERRWTVATLFRKDKPDAENKSQSNDYGRRHSSKPVFRTLQSKSSERSPSFMC